MFSLNNKVALITGGGSGIGKAITELFCNQGATVLILEVNSATAGETVKSCKASGGNARAYTCDVSDHHSVIKLIHGIIEEYKRIDILVNSAGIAHIGKLETTAETDLDRIYNVNVKGVYNTMYALIPHFKKQNAGVILNLASVVSTVAIPDRFAYSMSKGAVYAMTLSVARDYVNENIRCNCISPARVHTTFVDNFIKQNYPGQEKEMFEKLSKTQPIGRMGKPEEIAFFALYLCSDEAAFVTGTDYPIDGGFIKLK